MSEIKQWTVLLYMQVSHTPVYCFVGVSVYLFLNLEWVLTTGHVEMNYFQPSNSWVLFKYLKTFKMCDISNTRKKLMYINSWYADISNGFVKTRTTIFTLERPLFHFLTPRRVMTFWAHWAITFKHYNFIVSIKCGIIVLWLLYCPMGMDLACFYVPF